MYCKSNIVMERLPCLKLNMNSQPSDSILGAPRRVSYPQQHSNKHLGICRMRGIAVGFAGIHLVSLSQALLLLSFTGLQQNAVMMSFVDIYPLPIRVSEFGLTRKLLINMSWLQATLILWVLLIHRKFVIFPPTMTIMHAPLSSWNRNCISHCNVVAQSSDAGRSFSSQCFLH